VPQVYTRPTVTNSAGSEIAWNGETGYINREMLAKFVSDLTQPIYYTAGPPGLVAAMKDMLSEAGVDDGDVNSEDFSGY